MKTHTKRLLKKKSPARALPKTMMRQRKPAARVRATVTPIGHGEIERRVYVRFDKPGKELVRKAAKASKAQLSPYISHFAMEAAKAGKVLEPVPATSKEAGVFARFPTAAAKNLVRKMAAQSGLSLSAYAAHFALEAAGAGKKMPARAGAEKAAAAS